jgi:hypothetical protein
MTELIDKLNNININNDGNTIEECEPDANTNTNTISIWEHILNTIKVLMKK